MVIKQGARDGSMIENLQEKSVWIDTAKRTIIVWRVVWANTVSVSSYELLILPDAKIVTRRASEIDGFVRDGKMQFCKQM